MHKTWVTEEIVVVSSSQKVPSVRRVKSIIQSFEIRQGRHQTISSVVDVKMSRRGLLNAKSIRVNMTQLPQSVQVSYGRYRAKKYLLILR